MAICRPGVSGLKNHTKTIGLFNAKAENVIKTCKILIAQHNSNAPEDRTLLQALPGVGRKTANVVLTSAYGHPTIAVDRHIFRSSNRTKVAPRKNLRQAEEKLLKVVPEEFKVNMHHRLILRGRYICVALAPHCGACVSEDLYVFKDRVSI